ncbi:MAG TPA: 50S ribosomal protein L15 [Candidatus Limnocylindria bacterium]|nr:50S ribosomal protein L15 [Candidatus Limnocylindria bacterium]
MKLHDLHPAPGSHKPPRRVGRGHGSGRGKTAGRGTKGQKSRAGASIPAWFEGGQTPLHVRTPKLHGFKNRFRVEYAPVNLARLAEAASGTLITPDVLVHDGILSDTKRPLKILGNGDAPAGVTIHAHAFSRTAADKLAAAGSSIERLSWPDNQPVNEAEADASADDSTLSEADAQADEAADLAVEQASADEADESVTAVDVEETPAESES